jgi:hypothetical protein
VTAFTALVIVSIPDFPYIIDDALSEKAVLDYAHKHGWRFGTDIVFTYGPCGFLASRYFFPDVSALRFVVDIALAFCVSGGVVALAWATRKLWRILLLTTFLFLTSNINPRYDLLLYCGMFSWATLALMSSGRRLAVSVIGLSLLVSFSALVKSNFLIVGGVTVCAVLTDLVIRRERKPALVLGALVFSFFFAGWFATGQSSGNLGSFFSHILTIAKGYNSAVGLNGLEVLRRRGTIALLLAVCSVAFRASVAAKLDTKSESADRALILRMTVVGLWLMGLVFLVWKHGFVRADMFHMGFFFGFCPFFVLGAGIFAVVGSWRARMASALGLLSWAIVLFTLQRWCFAPLPGSLVQPFRQMAHNARIILHPKALETEMASQMAESFSKLDLPKIRSTVGDASVDVFGQDQIYALHNRLNYRPRPVFQSYMAYNRDLNALNESVYVSSMAPRYVLFELTPIDHKFPTLEDSFVLRDLLLNYRPMLKEAPVLLLRQESIKTPRLSLLQERSVHPGEAIDLKGFGESNLWAEIQVEQTFAGTLRSFTSKTPPLWLGIRTDGSRRNYKAPAPMVAAGFMLSPLLMDQSDVIAFYASRGYLVEGSGRPPELRRPDSVSIELDKGTERLWKNQVVFRIYGF